jgi:tRNA G18 (ribose-2'-O)-methylase SpoU
MRKLRNSELNRLSINDFKIAAKTPLVVILDNIRSLNNIGSVFRTSDAFLIEKIVLCGITAKPPHKDIHKTALGATDSVNWEYAEHTIDAINKLKTEGYLIVSIEQTEKAIMLQDFQIDTKNKYAIVFGNEVKGVKQEVVDISDFAIEIPQYGTKHSLNISVSAGVVIWEFFKKLKSLL